MEEKATNNTLLVGYHGELKVNLFHNIRIIQGLYYPKGLKVTYSTTKTLDGPQPSIRHIDYASRCFRGLGKGLGFRV